MFFCFQPLIFLGLYRPRSQNSNAGHVRWLSSMMLLWLNIYIAKVPNLYTRKHQYSEHFFLIKIFACFFPLLFMVKSQIWNSKPTGFYDDRWYTSSRPLYFDNFRTSKKLESPGPFFLRLRWGQVARRLECGALQDRWGRRWACGNQRDPSETAAWPVSERFRVNGIGESSPGHETKLFIGIRMR